MEKKPKMGRPVIKPNAEMFSLKIDKDLKRWFKFWCAQSGTTMTDEVESFIRSLRDKKPKAK